MDNYALLRLTKYHTFNQIKQQQLHNDREIYMPHIDANKTIQNTKLIDCGGTYTEAWSRRMKTLEAKNGKKIHTRRNAVLAIEFVLTFSPEMTEHINVKEWALANKKWLQNKFGEDNVLTCTLHMDESTPHIHATIIPIDKNNRLCAKNIINGPASLKQLQDDYAMAMMPFGLKRGEKHSKAKKESLVHFYDSINEIEKNPAPERSENESDEDYIIKLRAYCGSMRMAYANMKQKAKRTDDIINSRIANALAEYQNAIRFYDLLLKTFDGDSDMVEKRLLDLSQLELSIPRDKFETLILSLKDRFPINENVATANILEEKF